LKLRGRVWISSPNLFTLASMTYIFSTHMAKASFTSVGNSADSPKLLLRLSPATGHVTEILDT
jgi:hypothetical protein